jgi:hypothetical protein
MNNARPLHWPFIIGLGALGLLRPVASLSGLIDLLGRPLGPILITVLIAGSWIAIVIFSRLQRPILTLVLAGVVYAVLAILLSTIFPVVTGVFSGPITNPYAITSILITNAIGGALVGLCAWGLIRLRTVLQQPGGNNDINS